MWKAEYEAFGTTTSENGSIEAGAMYTGKEFDEIVRRSPYASGDCIQFSWSFSFFGIA